MLWRPIESYIHGYLLLKIQGEGIEKFINQTTRAGIVLWDLKRRAPNLLLLKIRQKDFPLIRRFFRKTGCRGRILRRSGWPFLLRKVVTRRGFILGMVIFLLSLHLLSSFIWFIGVEGAEKISRHEVIDKLYRLGLYPGTPRERIKEKRDWIIRELKIEFPAAVWISVKIKGVVAQVTVVEKKLPPPREDDKPAALFAVKDGLITEMMVIEGTPLVKEGDTVSRGDILILGEKVLRRLDGSVETQEVKAIGRVRARVWYEVKVEEPLTIWTPVTGPEKRTELKLRIAKRMIPFFSWGKISGKTSLSRRRIELVRGRNQLNLVELIKDTYSRITWFKRNISLETALNRAKAEGKQKMAALIPQGVRMERVNEEWEVQEGFLLYRLVGETLEDIAETYRKEDKK